MKAIIIEDDTLYSQLLVKHCETASIDVVGIFNDSMEALRALKKNVHADIVFLDIHMPKLNGFELLDSIPESHVIVTTQDDTMAIQAFDYDVVDFLLKPIAFKRFLKAVNKVESILEKKETALKPESDYVFVNINKRLVKIAIANLNYIQAEGNYIKIVLTGQEPLMVHTTLKKVKDSLPANEFMQVHRSYLVNLCKIVDIEDSSIVIEKSVIPIGKSYRDKLINRLRLLN